MSNQVQIQSVIDAYRELNLEIELLKFKVEYLRKEMSLMVASIDKERSMNLIAEHESLSQTIEELERQKLNYKLILMAYISEFKNEDILIFIECFLKQERIEDIASKYHMNINELTEKYNKINEYMNKEVSEE